MIKANFAIDRKVQSELVKNKQELFPRFHTAWKSLPLTNFHKLQEKMFGICSAMIKKYHGEFFDEKKI